MPPELSHGGQLAAFPIGAADRFGGSIVDGDMPVSYTNPRGNGDVPLTLLSTVMLHFSGHAAQTLACAPCPARRQAHPSARGGGHPQGRPLGWEGQIRPSGASRTRQAAYADALGAEEKDIARRMWG